MRIANVQLSIFSPNKYLINYYELMLIKKKSPRLSVRTSIAMRVKIDHGIDSLSKITCLIVFFILSVLAFWCWVT